MKLSIFYQSLTSKIIRLSVPLQDGALVRACNHFRVSFQVSGKRLFHGLPGPAPLGEFLVGHAQIDAVLIDIDINDISVLYQSDRSACCIPFFTTSLLIFASYC